MGMHLHTYLIIGYKTTREEAEQEWGDKFWDLMDENFDNIMMACGEGSDIAIIGEILASTDQYSDAVPIEIESPVRTAEVLMRLQSIGIHKTIDDIKLYLFGAWS